MRTELFRKGMGIMMVIAAVAALFSGCGQQRYQVNYVPSKDSFEGAKSSYAPGEEVVVYVTMFPTDCSTNLTLDGEPLRFSYDDKGMRIAFVMPDHDVTLSLRWENDMVYVPPEEVKEEVLLSYTDSDAGIDAPIEATTYRIVSGGADTNELVVETTVDGVYTKRERYLVNYLVLQDCLQLMETENVHKWAEAEETDALDGAWIGLAYQRDGEAVQVSTDSFPPGGERVLYSIGSMLRKAAAEGQLLEQETFDVDGTLHLSIDGEEVDVRWEDNETIRKIRELAKGGPIVADCSAYGGFEQVGDLGMILPSKDEQMVTEPGDIVLYQSGKIVLFYGSNQWSYTKLGHIQGLTQEELADRLAFDEVRVEIWIED